MADHRSGQSTSPDPRPVPRLAPLPVADAPPEAREVLERLVARQGQASALVRTMAHAPAVLRAYQELARALKRGVLDVRVREQIALAVAALTGCEYCRVSHTRAAEAMGLSEAEIAAALEGRAGDPRADAAVRLAVAAAGDPHDVDDADVERARSVGLGDGEIAEILAHVALNLFTNTFTIVAGTPVDPPSPADRSRAA